MHKYCKREKKENTRETTFVPTADTHTHTCTLGKKEKQCKTCGDLTRMVRRARRKKYRKNSRERERESALYCSSAPLHCVFYRR